MGGRKMKRSREEMKRAFVQEMAELFDQSMAQLEEKGHPTLTDIEEAVLKLRQRAGQRLVELLVEAVGEARPVPGPCCPRCGEEMHYKWSRQRTMETRVGAIRVQRGYFYCERCGAGFFPPGPAAGAGEASLE